jgi:Fe-S-cluster-containing dehydrogenase component
VNKQKQDLVSRRTILKLAGLSVGALLFKPDPACASGEVDAENAAAMLYDATKCIGCLACEEACKEWNNLPPEAEPPSKLSASNFTVVEEYETCAIQTYCKVQCMHCLHPACVSVCPVQALEKTEAGPVIYHPERCIGCRYCMVSCPFGVPQIDWNETLPTIAKCTFCADRQAEGLQPACAEVCPTGALKFGTRTELLEVARSRIEENPGRYVDHVYGETEAGGTSWLYISPVRCEQLDLPVLGPDPIPALSEKVAMIGTPSMLGGVAAVLGGIYWASKRRAGDEANAVDVEGRGEG